MGFDIPTGTTHERIPRNFRVSYSYLFLHQEQLCHVLVQIRHHFDEQRPSSYHIILYGREPCDESCKCNTKHTLKTKGAHENNRNVSQRSKQQQQVVIELSYPPRLFNVGWCHFLLLSCMYNLHFFFSSFVPLILGASLHLSSCGACLEMLMRDE